MPCLRPAKAFSLISGGISFKETADTRGDIKIPCGQCVGCRLDRARDWSLRITHESKLHQENWFITLTYNPENIPNPPSLDYSHWQKAARRIRKSLGPFRFFMCGEYGDRSARPHYHVITFGLHLPDLKRYGGSDKKPLWISPRLTELWGKGNVIVAQVTPQSANYVARYNLKKVTGKMADDYYKWIDPDTGEVTQLEPEFCHMSTRPGLGAAWYEKYHRDVHTHDYVILDGAKNPVPRYYDKLAAKFDYQVDELKQQREINARPKAWNNTPERLAVRETVLKARQALNKRPL